MKKKPLKNKKNNNAKKVPKLKSFIKSKKNTPKKKKFLKKK